MITGCIYKFENKIDGKVYIGKSINIEHRYKCHINCSKPDSLLHKAFLKQGIDNFIFSIVEKNIYENKKEANKYLDALEREYIAIYQSNDPERGYNQTLGGEGASGAIRSDYTKFLMSISKRGEKNPCKRAEVRKKISETLKRKYKTGEIISHPMSQEARKKISENMKGEKNPMFGRKGNLNPSFGVNWIEKLDEEKISQLRRKISERTRGERNPMYGKSAMKGKHYPKYKYLNPENNNTYILSEGAKKRLHPDWIKVDE